MVRIAFYIGNENIAHYFKHPSTVSIWVQRVQWKAPDALGTLGLLSSSLRLIERGIRGDNWIKYLGMVLVIIFFISIWWLVL